MKPEIKLLGPISYGPVFKVSAGFIGALENDCPVAKGQLATGQQDVILPHDFVRLNLGEFTMLFRARAVLFTTLIAAAAFSTACTNQAAGPVDDATITKDVKARLHAEFGPMEHREASQMERGASQDIPSYIDVSSSNGVVTLTGEVHGNKVKAKAAEIAKSVSHVASVVNQLGVAPGYSDDSMGTSK
jgi:hypothetical protein